MVSLLRPQIQDAKQRVMFDRWSTFGQVNLLSDFIGLSFQAWNLGRCGAFGVAKIHSASKSYTDGSEKTNGKLYFPQNNKKCLDFFGEWFRNPCQRLLVTSNWIKSYFEGGIFCVLMFVERSREEKGTDESRDTLLMEEIRLTTWDV